MTRIAIIGAGVVGAAIACRLAMAGRAVTLIDPRPGGIASQGSFGWLNAASGVDLRYVALRRRSLELWHAIAREHPDCPVAFPGMLLWEQSGPALEAQARTLSGLGHAAELIGRARIARIEPGLTDPPEAALWLPDEGWAEPRAVAGWFARAAIARGTRLRSDRVMAIERMHAGWELRLGAGRVEADELVLAAGAATPGLLAPLGITLRLRTEPGLLVRSTPAPATIRCLLGSPDVHLWQGRDGTLLAGSDYGGTQRFAEPEAEAEAILARAARLAAGLGRLRADVVTVTDRPMLPDDRPAVGRLAESLSVAVTHSGMTLAPLIADAVAAEIAGRAPDPELAPYRPDRPAITGATAEA